MFRTFFFTTFILHFFLFTNISGWLNAAELRLLTELESADGRIKASWQLNPAKPQLSDTIQLILEIQAETTLRVEMPVFGTALGELEIANITEHLVGISEGRETKQLILSVIPKHGGMMPIWQTPISYIDRREGLQNKPALLIVPETQFEVFASVSPETASLDQIKTPPEILEIKSKRLFWLIVAIFILTTIAVFLFLRFRYKIEKLSAEPSLSPREIALRRLALLIENRYHETDIKKFFIELTGIVRWYIEQQTNIRAPELTTEEFLHEITQHGHQHAVLPPELQGRLQLFLEAADMVKFARFQPEQDEIMLSVRRAEEFISTFALSEEI